jgi:hypothetical protein
MPMLEHTALCCLVSFVCCDVSVVCFVEGQDSSGLASCLPYLLGTVGHDLVQVDPGKSWEPPIMVNGNPVFESPVEMLVLRK